MPRVRIRTSLLTLFLLVILLLAGAILYANVRAGQEIAEDLGGRYLEKTRDLVAKDLDTFFQPVMTGIRSGRTWARDGVVDPAALEKSNAVYLPVLHAIPQVTSIATGDVDGFSYRLGAEGENYLNRITYAGVPGKPADYSLRKPDGSLIEAYSKATKFDPRKRPWYAGARERLDEAGGDAASARIFWTAPFILNTSKNPGIAAALPYAGPDGKVYMMTFNVMLTKLSNFTASLRPSPNGMAMVLTDDGRIVGFPATDDYDTAEKRLARIKALGNRMPALDEVGHPALAAVKADLPGIQAAGVADRRRVEVDGEPWRMIFERYALEDGPPLWIAVAVPESDFLAQVKQQQRNILLVSALAVLAAILLAFFMSRLYGNPLRRLVRESERITSLDLTAGEPIESHVIETHRLVKTQESMRAALESFSKYIPTAVVRELLRRGEAAQIGGASRPVTILFTDIRSFTTISESMAPAELSAHLAGYFGPIMEIIGEEHGSVDKMIGDAIMAMWGAPVEDAHHARDAVRAAVRAADFVASFNASCEAAGKPPLWTGFGVATGDAYVGNFGAPSRLNFTALGDVVNLSARLEGATKVFGSTILCSNAAREEAGDEFLWVRIDTVGVKGKTQPEAIHEPLGRASDADDALRADVATYERALAQRAGRDFDGAIATLGAIAPASRLHGIATALIARCTQLQDDPPPADWDGVWWLDTK